MPRDQRLFITLPIDIHRHPKLRNQPAEVKWAFVEMNIEAVIAGNNGRFPQEDAEFLWPIEILDALVKTHPSRPLVYREHNGGDYVIREFAEHQMTTEDRERRAAVSRANGAKGGRPRKNPGVTQQEPGQVSSGTQQEPTPTRAKAESESESEDFFSPPKGQSRDTRASVSTDAIEIPEVTKRLARQKGITSLRVVVDALHRHTSATVDAAQAYRVAVSILERAPKWPDAPQRYVLAAIAKNPAEIEQLIYGAVA